MTDKFGRAISGVSGSVVSTNTGVTNVILKQTILNQILKKT